MTDTFQVPTLRRAGRLNGSTAIVTGGGSMGDVPGSGAAISILFASEGANVVIDGCRRHHAARSMRGGCTVDR
jgi:NAD(P)-dependent dehydrogenase (short-subunit alcohol dehydrogenase family)